MLPFHPVGEKVCSSARTGVEGFLSSRKPKRTGGNRKKKDLLCWSGGLTGTCVFHLARAKKKEVVNVDDNPIAF